MSSWKSLPLIEVLDYEQPNPYIIETPITDEKGLFPVLTANKSFIKGYTNETKGVFKDVPVIIFDDFTADYKYVDFSFKVKSSAMKFLKSKNEKVLLKYIYYQMSLVKVDTSTHKRYYISVYQDKEFLFPVKRDGSLDFDKQEEIVEEIEKQFTRLDEAVKLLKNVKNKFKLYRKSVLKAAFNGRLTNHKDVFTLINIGSVTDLTAGNAFKKAEYTKSGVRLFQIANVSFGEIKWDEVEYVPEFYLKEYPRLALKKGDLLMALNRPLLNHRLKTAFLSDNDVPAILYQRVGRFDFNNKIKTNPKYFFYYLQSKEFLSQLEMSLQGVNIPFINKSKLMSFKFPNTLPEIQERIVQEIESHFSVIDKIEETVNSSLNKAELLRKSILKSAFEGKLVKA